MDQTKATKRIKMSKNDLVKLRELVVGKPLMMSPEKLDIILGAVGSRMGLDVPEGTAKISDMALRMGDVRVQGGIAVIPVEGSLVKRARIGSIEAASGLLSYEDLGTWIMDAATDPEIKGIVLDIDSGGGQVDGLFELVDMVREASEIKPVWAATGSAFSAAYAIAAATDKVFVSRAGGVGSIGVVAVHVDESEKDKAEGRLFSYITAGDKKANFNQHAPLSGAARTDLQEEIDRLYAMFVDSVAKGRGMTGQAVEATEAGLFFGEKAVESGLADQVGTDRDAIKEMQALFSGKESGQLSPAIAGATEVETKGTEMDELEVEAAMEKVRVDERKRAQDVTDLCLLAGLEEMASEMNAKGMSVADAGPMLIRAKAAREAEVALAPMSPAAQTQDDQGPAVMMAAAMKLAKVKR